VARATANGRYTSTNETAGLRYKPVDDVMFRLSASSAFTAPSMSQLRPTVYTPPYSSTLNGITYTNGQYPWTLITDPLRGNTRYGVQTHNPGAPDLRPETAKGVDWGVILTPRAIPGLRVSLDYSKVTKYHVISTLSAQTLVNDAPQFNYRITRAAPAAGDPYGVGPITLIDTASLNLLKAFSSSYIAQIDYTAPWTQYGTWSLSAEANVFEHYQVQTTFGQPLVEYLSNPAQAGQPSKVKGNVSLRWKLGRWSAGWTARYYGPYTIGYQYDAQTLASDAVAAGINPATVIPFAPGGGFNGWINGQIYHDLFVQYSWGKAAAGSGFLSRALADTSVQLNVTNVFNHYPPFDPSNTSEYYSYYGDIQLATYTLSIKHSF
jgi:CRISPR-associated Cas5-like protein